MPTFDDDLRRRPQPRHGNGQVRYEAAQGGALVEPIGDARAPTGIA
jgi:hypothetical protein